MVHYKLTYLDGRGLAEVIRQLFVVAKKEFDDVRISFEEMPKHKEHLPFGQVPVLEVDGKQLAQSQAIARYLAREFGYAGKNSWDEAWVDAICCQFVDFYHEYRPYLRAKFMGTGEDLNALANDVFLPAHKKLYTFMTKILKNNKSGYLVGDSLTIADLYLAETATNVKDFPTVYDGFPEVKAHTEKIRSIPELKRWIETRPETKF